MILMLLAPYSECEGAQMFIAHMFYNYIDYSCFLTRLWIHCWLCFQTITAITFVLSDSL